MRTWMFENLPMASAAMLLLGVLGGASIAPFLRIPDTTVPMWHSVAFLALIGGLVSIPYISLLVRETGCYERERLLERRQKVQGGDGA